MPLSPRCLLAVSLLFCASLAMAGDVESPRNSLEVADSADGSLPAGREVEPAEDPAVPFPLFPGARYRAGNTPNSVALADLNGDGALDLAVGNFGSDDVSVLLGAGNGGFAAEQRIDAGTRPRSVAVGDFNGDRVPDLVVANVGSDDVSVLLGLGDGGFAVQQRFGVGDQPTSVTVGDLNGDGLADLAVANSAPNDVSVLLGQGDGNFAAEQRFAVGGRPYSVTVGDFDGDGVPDLAVANYASNDVSVLIGQGDGSFAVERRYDVGGRPCAVVVGEFNGDGAPDLATANSVFDNVSVLLNRGDGSFLPEERYGAGQRPLSLAAGDFDGDGAQDLAIGNEGESRGSYVSVLLGHGDGVFHGDQPFFGVGSLLTALEAGDLNGDGALDVAVANRDDVAVLVGRGDGGFVSDRRAEAGLWPSSIAAGDLDGDRVPDLAAASCFAVAAMFGHGDGSFVFPTQSLEAGESPCVVALSDFDGDGAQDVAVVNRDSADVSVLLGDGRGGFDDEERFAVGQSPQALAVDDLDGDGVPDLCVANDPWGAPADVSVLLGLGDGGFAAEQRFGLGGEAPTAVALDDLDGDGVRDMIVALGNSVVVLRGRGDGTFDEGQSVHEELGRKALALDDLNGDGALDLVVTEGLESEGNVSVLPGRGDGSFAAARDLGVRGSPSAVAACDLDGDGVSDLAVTSEDPAGVSVLPGRGDASFAAEQRFSAGTDARAIAVSDFNGDGLRDLAVGNWSSRDVSILINQGRPVPRVEIDIRPGSAPNSINPGSQGVVPVALLGSAGFDVEKVDLGTLRFGPNGAAPAQGLAAPWVDNKQRQDLNHDGFADLLLHFRVLETGIACGHKVAALTGSLLDGTQFAGTDSIVTRGCPPARWRYEIQAQ